MDDDLTRDQLLVEVRALRARVATFERAAAAPGSGLGGPCPDAFSFRDLFDWTAGFIGVLTPDGTLVEVNRSPLEAGGFRREDLIGRPFWDTGWWNHAPAVQDQLRADFDEALRGQPVRREAVYFTAGGEERVVARTLTPVTDRDGRVVRVIAEGRDVTDRARAEAALARGERRFQALIEHQFDGIALVAADGTVGYVSPAARRLLGYAEDRVVGRSLFAFVHPGDRDRAARDLAGALREPRAVVRGEYRVEHADGPWRRVEAIAQNLLDEPALRAVVCNFRDVTEQRRAEDARWEGEERFRELFNQSAAGMAEADLTGRFVLVNRRFCELVGRPAEELCRLRVQDVTHPDDLPRNQELFDRAAQAGEPFVVEKRYARPDGSCVWAWVSVAAVRGGGGAPASVLGVAADVTPQKRAEEALRRARDELEERVAERTAELSAANEALRHSEAWFRRLMDHLPSGAYTCDADGRITYFNRRAAELWGCEPRPGDPAARFCK